MSYTLQYKDKKGRHVTVVRSDENSTDIVNRMRILCASKIEAKVYHNGEPVGGVFEDNSVRTGFNYTIGL